MTTAFCTTEISDTLTAPCGEPVETQLSDAEILRRVEGIKATWSLDERAARRREADRRFESLIDAIFAEAA